MEVKNWMIGVGVFVLLLIGVIIFRERIEDRIAERTLEKMQHQMHKPYSPSPFGPGYDPDKMDGYRGMSFDKELVK